MTFFVKKKTTVQNTSIKSYQYVPFMTFLLIKQSKKDVSVTCKLSETRGGGGATFLKTTRFTKYWFLPFVVKKCREMQSNMSRHDQEVTIPFLTLRLKNKGHTNLSSLISVH